VFQRILFLVVALQWLFWGGTHALADTFEVYRNSKPFLLKVTLPGTAEFSADGIDRKAYLDGIDINLRLIQDTYSSCATLVRERISNRAKDGYKHVSSDTTNSRDCSLLLKNSDGNMVSSFYVWLKRCQCFSAMHFSYDQPSRQRYLEVSQGILDSLRKNNYQTLQGEIADFGGGKPCQDYEILTCDQKRARGYVLDRDEIDHCGGLARRNYNRMCDATGNELPPPENADIENPDSDYDTSSQEAAAAAEEAARAEREAEEARAEAERQRATVKITNNDRFQADIAFYSQSRRVEWPGNNQHWIIQPGETQTFNLRCQPNEKICYGAWRDNNYNRYWGAGFEGKQACDDCCFYCGRGTFERGLGDGGPYDPPQTSQAGPSASDVIDAIAGGLILGGAIAESLGGGGGSGVTTQYPRPPAQRQSDISGTD
jgi:hypothetical protein